MTDELFNAADVTMDSPRLAWLKRHNLALGELPDGMRFCASHSNITRGDTHKACELSMAKKLGISHWEVDEIKKAGVTMPENVVEEW